jgi:sRNA-binding protein
MPSATIRSLPKLRLSLPELQKPAKPAPKPPIADRFALLRAAGLIEPWPAVLGGEPLPLAIGTRQLLIERMGAAATTSRRNKVSRLLRAYCRSARYLRAMAAPGAMRHDLDGNPVEPVSDEHRANALEMLDANKGERPRVSPAPRPEARRCA